MLVGSTYCQAGVARSRDVRAGQRRRPQTPRHHLAQRRGLARLV